MADEIKDLVERLRYTADINSRRFDDDHPLVGELRRAADALSRIEARALAAEAERDELKAEVERCHARLEIDHYFKLSDNDDQDLERVEIPMAERGGFPDAVASRDATIELLQTDIGELKAERDRVVEALERITEHPERKELTRDKNGELTGSSFGPSWAFYNVRRIAREALSSIKGRDG